jgi:transcriptional regulator with XRE-family HTH domain
MSIGGYAVGMASRIPINGEVLRDLRVLRLLSQEGLAHAAGCTREEISAYERGIRKPRPAQLDRIVTALERYPVKAQQWLLIKTPALDKVLAMIEGPMNRRELIKLLTAGTGAHLTFPAIDLSEVSLHQATQDLISCYPTVTPAESLAAARALLNRQYQALRTAAMLPGERRELLADAVVTAVMAGWAARIAGQPADSAALIALAEDLAEETDLAFSRGLVLTSKANLRRPISGDGDTLAGLELARAAEPLVGSRGPLVQYVMGLQAEMLAALGTEHERESLRALDRMFAMPDGEDPIEFFSRQGQLPTQWAASCHTQLGRPDEALEHLKEAMATGAHSQTVRGRCLTQCQTAHAYAVAGDPEATCHHAQAALDGSLETGYELGVRRVRFARAQLPDTCADLACVRELDERLATSA